MLVGPVENFCLSLCLDVLTPKLLEGFRAHFVMEYSHWTLSSEIDVGSCSLMGLDSVVGATRYGLDGPGIKSLWGKNFRTRPDRSWRAPSLLYKECSVISGGRGEAAG
jgi:hypothetical protein